MNKILKFDPLEQARKVIKLQPRESLQEIEVQTKTINISVPNLHIEATEIDAINKAIVDFTEQGKINPEDIQDGQGHSFRSLKEMIQELTATLANEK